MFKLKTTFNCSKPQASLFIISKSERQDNFPLCNENLPRLVSLTIDDGKSPNLLRSPTTLLIGDPIMDPALAIRANFLF
jgi:hypothetical protein